MSLLSLFKRIAAGRRLTAYEHDQNLSKIENAINNPPVQIRRAVLAFDGFNTVQDVEAVVRNPNLAARGFQVQPLSAENQLVFGRTNGLVWTTPPANGSAVHTGAKHADYWLTLFVGSNDADWLAAPVAPILAPLELQPGDQVTVNFTFFVETVSRYPGADAGGYIYPGVKYHQGDDWRNYTVRFWIGDNGIGWGIPQQQLQYAEFFGAACWTSSAPVAWYPMTVGYDFVFSNYIPSAGTGTLNPVLTVNNLWAENQMRVVVTQVEFISRRGESKAV